MSSSDVSFNDTYSTMYVTRQEFISLIEEAILDPFTSHHLNDADKDALMEVADTAPACAVGNMGPKFDDWPAPSEPIYACMCPARQARLYESESDRAEGSFGVAFDRAATRLQRKRVEDDGQPRYIWEIRVV